MPGHAARPRAESPLLDASGDIHCRLLFAHEVAIGPSWRFRFGDPYWRLYQNLGEGAFITGPAGMRPIPAGRLVLVPAWSRLDSGCQGHLRHRHVHFDPMGLPADWVREHCRDLMVPAADPAREARFDRLFSAGDGSPAWRLRLQAVVVETLAAGLDALPAEALAGLSGRAARLDPVAPALACIREHLAEELAIPALAARCGYTADHFTRLFRERVGQGPARYIQERRVAVAAERLLASEDDIDRIATETGFANRFHFSRVFTRHMGQPPASYRRRGRW